MKKPFCKITVPDYPPVELSWDHVFVMLDSGLPVAKLGHDDLELLIGLLHENLNAAEARQERFSR